MGSVAQIEYGVTSIVIDNIPGISRKQCTITFEPHKGACYMQDLSTNGTYLNGKRLPRPPYKNPQDARVRLFHGAELSHVTAGHYFYPFGSHRAYKTCVDSKAHR